MSTFIQLHLLTSYPPSNLNRDDLGRPKTAVMGGRTRLRISSQSLKRAWRTSAMFESAMTGHIGKRTKKMGITIYNELCEKGVQPSKAKELAMRVVEFFGATESPDKNNPLKELESSQLIHFNQSEMKVLSELTDKIARNNEVDAEDLKKLVAKRHDVDISMFGRMLTGKEIIKVTDDPEAAVQVSHAITVHEVAVEDDYFTAVDDLNNEDHDLGAAHIGETEFGAGLFYLYLCINRDLLIENLGNDQDLANQALAALVETAAKVAPTGKQNSFASRAYASYILAEKGERQPRSLSVSFLKPLKSGWFLDEAIDRLENTRKNLDGVYFGWEENGQTTGKKVAKSLPSKKLNAVTGEGSLEEIITFVKG